MIFNHLELFIKLLYLHICAYFMTCESVVDNGVSALSLTQIITFANGLTFDTS